MYSHIQNWQWSNECPHPGPFSDFSISANEMLVKRYTALLKFYRIKHQITTRKGTTTGFNIFYTSQVKKKTCEAFQIFSRPHFVMIKQCKSREKQLDRSNQTEAIRQKQLDKTGHSTSHMRKRYPRTRIMPPRTGSRMFFLVVTGGAFFIIVLETFTRNSDCDQTYATSGQCPLVYIFLI